ncbi:hypothetical protein HQ489_04840 [Candidatus Woesearchaeota archaeon]|nr:hypothetical protein [Candidatus Woesearchaeota archaeon]
MTYTNKREINMNYRNAVDHIRTHLGINALTIKNLFSQRKIRDSQDLEILVSNTDPGDYVQRCRGKIPQKICELTINGKRQREYAVYSHDIVINGERKTQTSIMNLNTKPGPRDDYDDWV